MKIVVIGAGAAGLLAAGKAAETADEVVIIEKNDIIGKKLLITGKGRCNITNSADIEDRSISEKCEVFVFGTIYVYK